MARVIIFTIKCTQFQYLKIAFHLLGIIDDRLKELSGEKGVSLCLDAGTE